MHWRLLGLTMAAFALGGCATNAVTGRSQYVLVSEQSAIAQSAQAYSALVSQLDKNGKLKTDDPALQARIDAITGRLIAQAIRYRPETRDWAWSVKIIDDPETVNAFCMAGGKMAIYTGLIDKIRPTDDELAQVMGHEIGHAIANHSAEKMSVAMTAQIGVTIFAALGSSRNRDLRYGGGAIAAAAIVTLPNSRSAETEADRIGIELAARAGYDPDSAVSLWKKMAANSGAKSRADFLSTHPSPLNRIDDLQARAPDMKQFYLSQEPRPKFDLASRQLLPADGPAPEQPSSALVAGGPLMLHTPEFERFAKGEAVLGCEGACAVGFALKHGDWKKLFDQGLWRQLVQRVVAAGYHFDVTYFYLGRAAETLGHAEAARRYYQRSIEAAARESTRCKGRFQDWCDRQDLPRLAEERLAAADATQSAQAGR